MNWKYLLGRLLMAVPAAVLVLLFAWLGLAQGIFGGVDEAEAVTQRLMYAFAFVILVAMGFIWSRKYGLWALLAIVLVSLAGIFDFTSSDHWSDDLVPFLLAYPVMALGYWLSRPAQGAGKIPRR